MYGLHNVLTNKICENLQSINVSLIISKKWIIIYRKIVIFSLPFPRLGYTSKAVTTSFCRVCVHTFSTNLLTPCGVNRKMCIVGNHLSISWLVVYSVTIWYFDEMLVCDQMINKHSITFSWGYIRLHLPDVRLSVTMAIKFKDKADLSQDSWIKQGDMI